MPDPLVVIEFVGEGKADIGPSDGKISLPDRGVIPILVHKLCGSPPNMRARRDKQPFLRPGSLHRKLNFAKREAAMRMAHGESHGLVFVVDTEGEHPEKIKKIRQANGEKHLDLPTAVGVAHPCIESWLLADAKAVKNGLRLSTEPVLPEIPESLPAPCNDRINNPKTILAGYLGRAKQQELTAVEKTAVANLMLDMEIVRSRCPMSFAPFADEVVERI